MPISWTAEVDQRLFQTTMDVCGVTINGTQYNEIAERMGDGFTVEALKHRFRRIKSQSGKAAGGGGTPRKGGTTPKALKTGGTPRSGRSKKQVSTDAGTDDSGNDEKKLRASPRKRAAKSYAEPATDDEGDGDDPEEPESPTKKVKHEKEDDDAAGSFFDQDEEV
ncbi:hypothetical protein SLS55_001473 [Diplodia seriata]|uniref:Myb-like domain-containing protein n=1 Tax=Diplodia seriata TaxID=420778 RepID=A0ABR3CPG6_9PEZI